MVLFYCKNVIFGGISMKKRTFAILLSFCLLIGLLPAAALAAENTMTFGDFLLAVEADNGTFDGAGVTVKWEPDESVNIIHRIQNSNAQYQIFGDLQNISISNVHFEYVPADIPNHSDGWSGINQDYTKDQIRNAEFQFLNSGNVTITNCTFEKIIVSPYGQDKNRPADANRTFTVTNCTFSSVYNAYALKDIYPASAFITDCSFKNCSGAIYFEGGIARKEISIVNNTFSHIDEYAAEGKVDTRGVIQFSASGNLTADTVLTVSGNTITGNLVKDKDIATNLMVVRQICDLGHVTLSGWTPGDACSVKIDGASALTLPNMPSGTVFGATYTFQGWAAAKDYLGATDLTNVDKFLSAGAAGAAKTYYYAVWEKEASFFPVFPFLPEAPTEDVPALLNAADHDAYLQGYPDGTVRPENSITRAEVAAIFYRLLTDDARAYLESTDSGFSDVQAGDWYNTAVATMVQAGVITGYGDGTFRPNAPITRGEFAAIATRFLSDPYSLDAPFYDTEGHWAEVYINRAYELGWISGYTGGAFKPDKSITRAEVSAIVNRMLEREADPAYLAAHQAELLKFRDLPATHWAYDHIMEAANGHTYVSAASGETWTGLK